MNTPVFRARSCITSLVLLATASAALANNELWIGIDNVSADTNWSDNLNWTNTSGGGGPGPNQNAVFFGDIGGVGTQGQVTSVADQNGLNPFSMTFTNGATAALSHTILVQPGINVTNSTGITVGEQNLAANNWITFVSWVGPGSLVQNGTNMTIANSSSTAASGVMPTLDLSGLSNFVAAGLTTLNIGGSGGSEARGEGTLNLAVTNNITATNITMDTGGGNPASSGAIINLGLGINNINVTSFVLGQTKAHGGTVQFFGSTGTLRIRGVTGADTDTNVTLTLGDRNNSGSGTTAGSLLLNGHQVDIKSRTMIVGQDRSSSSTSTHAGSGTVQFDTGSITATNILMANSTSAGTASSATGLITVGGAGALSVGPGGITMGNKAGGSTGATATLTIASGIVNCAGNITKSNAGAVATITIDNTGPLNNNGTLSMASGTTIGVSTNPIDNVNLAGATLNLNVVGGASTPVINAINISASAVNTLNLSVANVNGSGSIPLIGYTGADPGTNTFVVNVPTNFVGTLNDNGSSLITLDLVPAGVTIYPLLWVGAVGSTVNGNWNYTMANWENLTNPAPLTYTNPDLVTFDDSASNSTVNLTASFTPGSLVFSNGISPNPLTGNPLAYTLTGAGSIGGSVTLINANSGSVTLQETGGDNFTGGLLLNGGTVVLDDVNSSISGGANIGNGATLQIGNNDANGSFPTGAVVDNGNLIFNRTSSSIVSSDITGGGNLIKAGSGTVTLTVSNEFTGTTTATNGALVLTGAGSLAANNTVDVDSNATLDVSGVTGVPAFQNLTLGNCTLTQALTNQQSIAVSGTLTLNASSTISINVTSLPIIAAYPTILTNVAGSGFNNGAPTLHLGSLPAGYAGSLSTSANGIILTLTSGPTGVRPNVIWSGVDALNSISTNWSDAQNWQLPGVPGPADNVIFNDTAAQGSSAYNSPGGGAANLNPANINNYVDANFTVATLNYTNLAGMYQNTYITDGMTLTVTTNMSVGSSSTDFGSSASEFVSFAGTNGSLTVNNTNSSFFVGLVFAGQGSEQATLDMSGLGTFNASVSNFAVGALATTAFGTIGTAYLAQTNNITAAGSSPNESGQDELLSFMVGETGKNGSTQPCNLYLGQQNTIFANSVGVSLAKENAQMSFNPTFVNPSATFYGAGGVGTPVSVWAIGDALAQTGGSTAPVGTADFTGGTVNALVTTMFIGRSPNASGPHPSTGTLTFGAGTISVGTMFVGFQAFSNTDFGVGTVNVNGTGILQVSTLNMAQTTGGGGTNSTSGTLIINGGTVEAGTIVGNGLSQSTITLQSSGTLAISNTAGTLAAPLTVLNLDGGTLQLSPINGGTNIVATTVSVSGTTTINIASVANASGTMQIPLIYYGASPDPFSSLTLGSTPLGFTGASLFDDTANQTVDLIITAPPTLTWAGALSNGSSDGNWNTSDLNWLNGATFVAYTTPDGALFNDSASNFVVFLTTTFTPINLTINSSSNYLFDGTGSIGGATSLIKQGTGTLTLDHRTLNTYTGGTIISAGTLQIGNNNDADGNLPAGTVADSGALVFDQFTSNTVTAVISGPGTVAQIGSGKQLLSGVNSYSGATLISSGTLIVGNAGGPSGTNSSLGAIPGGAVTITNGGTMDLGGNSTANQLGFTNLSAGTAKQFLVAGTGVGGNGAIVNNGTVSQDDALQYVSLTANATVGGPTRWDMRGAGAVFPVLNLTNNTLTKTGTNQISIVGATVTSGNIVVNQGILSFDTYVVFPAGSTGTITVNSAGSLGQFRGSLNSATNAGNASGLTRPITLNGGAVTNLSTSGAIGTNDAPITLTANSTLGGCTTNNYAIVFDGVIGDGLGGFGITKAGVGPVVFTAINTYGGATLVNSGSLALAGNGSIPSSSTITLALGATLDASGRTDQTLTLNNGQTLNGFGTVTGLVVAASGSTIAPGSSSSVGQLTVSSNSTLNGNTVMKLNTSTNDVLAAGGTVTYGGILTLTNISGTPLALGNSFKLFSAGTYNGAFASIVTQPPLAAGLSWNNSGSGVFTIVSAAAGPNTNASITHVSLSGTNLLVHGTNNNAPNTNFHYAVLVATNLATPLSNWSIVATNSFNPDGTFDYTNPIVPGTPKQFIDVKAVP